MEGTRYAIVEGIGTGEVGTCIDIVWNGFGVVWCAIQTDAGNLIKRASDVVVAP